MRLQTSAERALLIYHCAKLAAVFFIRIARSDVPLYVDSQPCCEVSCASNPLWTNARCPGRNWVEDRADRDYPDYTTKIPKSTAVSLEQSSAV